MSRVSLFCNSKLANNFWWSGLFLHFSSWLKRNVFCLQKSTVLLASKGWKKIYLCEWTTGKGGKYFIAAAESWPGDKAVKHSRAFFYTSQRDFKITALLNSMRAVKFKTQLTICVCHCCQSSFKYKVHWHYVGNQQTKKNRKVQSGSKSITTWMVLNHSVQTCRFDPNSTSSFSLTHTTVITQPLVESWTSEFACYIEKCSNCHFWPFLC